MRTPETGVLFAAAFGAGLGTGLLRFWVPAAVILALIAWVSKRPLLRFAVSAAALGMFHGAFARTAESRSCPARWHEGPVAATAHLLDPAEGGRTVRATVAAPGCQGHVRIRWPRTGEARPAGSEMTVSGTWLTYSRPGRRGGILLVRSVGHPTLRPTAGDRIRNRLAARSAQLYGSRAPLVDALILGQRGSLDDSLRDQFARAGLAHLLSISGFHVGVLVGWVVLAAGLLQRPRYLSLAIGAVGGVLYAAFLGFPAPALRAALLCSVGAWALLRQRGATASSVLAATCLLVVLIEPWAILQTGAWLSVSALWGAHLARRWLCSVGPDGFAAGTIAASAGATLATAPITAVAFGTVALAGLAINLAALPLAALAVPGVAGSLMIAELWPGLAAALAAGAGLALHLLEVAAAVGASWRSLTLESEPTWTAGLPWVGAIVAAGWIFGARNRLPVAVRRGALLLAATSWLAVVRPLATPTDDSGRLTLHFLDIGQGDAVVVRTPRGRTVLIDAGPRNAQWDAGRRVVAPFLRRQRVRELAVVVLSHAHLDHLGGMATVLSQFRAGIALDPGDATDDPAYADFLSQLSGDSVPWAPARRGAHFDLDGVRFAVVHPDTAWAEWGMDLNEDSAVLLVEYGGFRALLGGDAGETAEAEMAGRVGRVDVLKVGHHGSATATSRRWLSELQPTVAVISVGRRNRHGHPSPEAVRRLRAAGADIWRTDQDGSVTVRTDGRSIDISAGARHSRAAVAQTEATR